MTRPVRTGTTSKGTKNETPKRISYGEKSKIADGYESGRDDDRAGVAPGRRGGSTEPGWNCTCDHGKSGPSGRSHRGICPGQDGTTPGPPVHRHTDGYDGISFCDHGKWNGAPGGRQPESKRPSRR